MKANVVFANPASRLAAAQIAENDYIVFEFMSNQPMRIGEVLETPLARPGHMICKRHSSGRKLTINVLSSSMCYARAKSIVAPWQDEDRWEMELMSAGF